MAHPTIDAALVRGLIDDQFPTWRSLDVRPVDVDGWDNRTFRLGEELAVRLPSGPGYASQVRKEIAVLPIVAASVSLPVPEVVAVGEPGHTYPFEWTVRRWIDGTPARDAMDLDRRTFGLDVSGFLSELWQMDPRTGPRHGEHSAGRGGPLAQWDDQVRTAIGALGERADGSGARRVWEEALRATDSAPERWFHGDVAVGNLLTMNGRLSAVIDFGCAGVGDPACDLAIAWTFLEEADRESFRRTIGVDDALWARGAGWALWKALITVDDPLRAAESAFALRQVLS